MDLPRLRAGAGAAPGRKAERSGYPVELNGAVAACELGRVERLVGGGDDLGEGLESARLIERRGADRDRHVERIARFELMPRPLASLDDAFADREHGAAIRLRKNEDELFTAVARHDVRRSHVALQQTRRRDEHLVAGLMTAVVVHALEAV